MDELCLFLLNVGVYDVIVSQGGSPLVSTVFTITPVMDYALALVEESGSPAIHVITTGEQTALHLTNTPLAARSTYTFTLYADDGPQRQTLDIVLTVVAPDFQITPQSTQ